MRKQVKNNLGITLIALVVTIVVLLILAGVSISMLSGDSGIITQAQRAKEETRGATVEEARDLWMNEKNIDDVIETDDAKEIMNLVNDLYEEGSLTEDEANEILYGVGYITIGSHFIDFRINGEVDLGGVARIGNVLYATLQEAFDAVPADGTETTVVLLKNISENVLVEENKNIILNLGGKTITNIEGTAVAGDWEQAVFEIYGELELENGSIIAGYGRAVENYNKVMISDDIQISGTSNKFATILNDNDGVVNITGGILTAEKQEVVSNRFGTVNISGGELTGQSESALYPAIYNSSKGEVSISGGTIIAPYTTMIESDGTINISGSAKLISYATTHCAPADIDCYYATFNMSGGEIVSYSTNDVIRIKSGDATFTGGTIKALGTGENALIIDGGYSEANTAEISGDFNILASSNCNYAIWIGSNIELTIAGGTITKEGDGYAVYNAGGSNIEHTGGTITGETYFGE